MGIYKWRITGFYLRTSKFDTPSSLFLSCEERSPSQREQSTRRHVATVALVQAGEEIGFLGVPDVSGDPFEVDAVGLGTIEEFQGDMMLGTIDDVIGNAGLATTFAVGAPAFGQEEFGVEHGAEARVVGTEGELDRDDTVGGLAEPTAILPLHAGSHLA